MPTSSAWSVTRSSPEQARERIASLDLPGSVEIRVADGSLGDPAGAPYDGIIVTAAAPAIPVELRDQLADGGRLVIPVGPRNRQILTLAVRHGNDWVETAAWRVRLRAARRAGRLPGRALRPVPLTGP